MQAFHPCAYDNVPGATLLVPYWRVSLNGATGAPIPTGGVDTLVSMVNVSSPGLIAHVTVWNKYSRAVLDFNVPMTGKDVVSFSMRDIMNGKLNVNFTQVQNFLGSGTGDPCGVNLSVSPAVYLPKVGFGAKQFIRFSHPEAGATNSDAYTSVSVYATDAFAAFRNRVWDSLDESGDVTSFTSSAGDNILDFDNPACGVGGSNGDGVFKTDLSGYLTIDVVNFCTNYFPENELFYNEDAIATTGWSLPKGCDPTIGIRACTAVVHAERPDGRRLLHRHRLAGRQHQRRPGDRDRVQPGSRRSKRFPFSRPSSGSSSPPAAAAPRLTGGGCVTLGVPPDFQFPGDGRETLGERYGFRYLSDQANGLQTWILVWRSDIV